MGISVLHVLHAYRPGGMENMIAQMAWALPRPEFSVAICALAGADDFKTRLPPDTPVRDLEKKRGLDFRCAMRLRQLIHEIQPDVVHSHNWNALVYSLLALGTSRRPLLHGEHALLYGWERSPWRLRLRKLFFARCDVVHTVSQGQALEMHRLGLDANVDVRVIRNGVDTVKFCPQDKAESRRRLGIPVEGLCLGMAARYVPEKRHALLLQAFEHVGVAFPLATLVLAGAGGMCEAETRALVERHPFADRIIWLGHRDDMAAVYNAFDLLVLTSTSEGMSNVTLEAMSCGVPVLMHAGCGSEELIHEGVNGTAVAMADAEGAAAAIGRLLERPGMLRDMGCQARSIVERDLPLAKTASDYAEVYRGLARKQQPLTEIH